MPSHICDVIMPRQKTVPRLFDLATHIVQNFVLQCLRATVRERRNRLPSTLDKMVAALWESVFKILPQLLHNNVLDCLSLRNVTIPFGPRATSTVSWERALYFAECLQLLARLCLAGAAVQRITTTEMWLWKIVQAKRGGTLTDVKVVPNCCEYPATNDLEEFLKSHPAVFKLKDSYQRWVESHPSPDWLKSVVNGCPRLQRLQTVGWHNVDGFTFAPELTGYLERKPNVNQLIEGCPELEEINLSYNDDPGPETFAKLLLNLTKLKHVKNTSSYMEYIAREIERTPTTDIPLQTIRCYSMNEKTQRIMFTRCRNLKSLDLCPPYNHLELCRRLEKLRLVRGTVMDVIPVFVGCANTLSHVDLSSFFFKNVSDIFVLAKNLHRLQRLELRDCGFSHEVTYAKELTDVVQGDQTATKLFPKLKSLTLTHSYVMPPDNPMPVNVLYFFLAAAKDVLRLQLDGEGLEQDAAECLRTAVVEKGWLGYLEELVTINEVNLNIADFDLLLGLCPKLKILGPLTYWTGMTKDDRDACARRVKQENLDLKLTEYVAPDLDALHSCGMPY